MFVYTLLVLSLTILLAVVRAEDTAQIACISYDAVPPDAIIVHPTFDGDNTANAVLCTVSRAIVADTEMLGRVTWNGGALCVVKDIYIQY
jgi:hypothetical protein